MRSGKVILFSVFVLAITAAWLLRRTPVLLPDNELALLAQASAPSAIEDEVASRDSAIAKGDAGPIEQSATTIATDVKRALGVQAIQALSSAEDKQYLQAAPLSKEEVKSVSKLFDTFFKNQKGKESLNKLIHDLRINGLDPVMAKDFNPYTGKMLTIRTNEALTGTRYFHAQYFEDTEQNKEPFRQHLSFEIRPSPDCMTVSQKIVESKLGKKLGTPIRVRGDEWIEWKKDDESIWIQRMGAEDLKHDSLNARTIADIGTCRAAIEKIPSEMHDKNHGAGTVH